MKHRIALVLASVGLTAALVAAAPDRPGFAEAEPELRLFDIRDMASSLYQHGDGTGSTLMMTTGAALSLRVMPVAEGVFAVQGDSDALDALDNVLQGLREMTDGRYQVELVASAFNATEAPTMGESLPASGRAMTRIQHIVQRRTETDLQSLESTSYIRTWQPIVSEQTVGYEGQIESIDHGLNASVTVGASDERERVAVTVTGEYSHATITQVEQPVLSSQAQLTYGLPHVAMRSIAATLSVQPGVPTVISIVDGFTSGEVIAIAVRVVPME